MPTPTLGSGYRALAVTSAAIIAIVIIGISGWFLLSGTQTEDAALLPASPIIPVSAADFTGLKAPVVDQRALAHQPILAASFSPVAPSESAPPPPPSVARAATAPSASASIAAPAPRPPVSKSPILQTTRPGTQPTRPGPTAPSPTRSAEVTVASGVRNTDDVVRARGSDTVEAAAPEPANNGLPRVRDGSLSPTMIGPLLTYTAGDAEVVPPAPIFPRLIGGLHPTSPGVRIDALTIAVVVEPDGSAYSVTAVNPPLNMGEYVLLTTALAAVKSWAFTPATKDGVPVRYRLVVPVRSVTGPSPP